MAVVVQQTVPFPPSTLQLDDQRRWGALFPLLRPSVHLLKDRQGLEILIDQDKLNRANVAIVAVPEPGKISSKLLDKSSAAVIVLGSLKRQHSSLDDLRQSLTQAGLPEHKSVLIVQAGAQYELQSKDNTILCADCDSTLEFDHILDLLDAADDSCRSSIDAAEQLLEAFARYRRTAASEFSTEKINGSPAIRHSDEHRILKSASDAISRDLDSLLGSGSASTKSHTWSLHFADLNGLSRLEIYIVAAEMGKYMDSKGLSYRLSHSSIVDYEKLARGYAISLAAVPSNLLPPQPKATPSASTNQADASANRQPTRTAQMQFVDTEVRRRIVSGCEAVITAEPTITEYDTIVGDGDCGYTLRDGAKQVLRFIEGKDLTALPDVVDALVQDLEVNMGGTSGALYCIFLTALASSLASESSIPKALQAALEQLSKYTRARLGDRTMMDALIPFVETLNASSDATKAIADAKKGVEGTKTMEAKLGRSTYLDESATQGVPDPGAYGLLILLEGMSNV